MKQRTGWKMFGTSLAASALLGMVFLAGCKSEGEKALDQAKAQAASTNSAQQIQYVDGNGDTVTTVVQPPVAGQPQQISTTTAPPPPGPPPHKTKPVISPYGGGAQGPVQSSATLAQATSGPVAPDNSSTAAASTATAPPAGQQAGPPPPVSLTVAAGTELAIRMNQTINVKHAVAGEHFSGVVAEPVVREGVTVIPRGTPVSGRVDEAHRRGHFKGASVLELRLTAMTLNGNEYALDTHDTVRTKKGKGKRSAGWIGGMTGAGMLIGGIATGGVGLAIGAASGAGAGTLIAGTTGNRDIVIPAESVVHFRLADQLVVQTP